jgi:hypothetical protein
VTERFADGGRLELRRIAFARIRAKRRGDHYFHCHLGLLEKNLRKITDLKTGHYKTCFAIRSAALVICAV